jgi:hypothetical protein
MTPEAEELARLRAENAAQAERIAELLDALEGMVDQHCSLTDYSDPSNPTDVPGLDSYAIGANAEAMELLEEFGRLEVTAGFGRRVLAKWKPKQEPSDA